MVLNYRKSVAGRLWFVLLILIPFGHVSLAQSDSDLLKAHKEVVRHLFSAAIAEGDISVMEDLLADDYIIHGIGADLDKAQYAGYMSALHESFPDFAVDVQVLIAEDEWVGSRVRYSGTFEGAWTENGRDIQPTNEVVSWTLNNFYRFDEEGLIVEEFAAFDRLSLLRQMNGLAPGQALLRLINSPERPDIQLRESLSSGMEEAHKETFMSVIEEAINNGVLTAIDSAMAEDYHISEPFGAFSREQFKDIIAGFREAVPDLHVDTEILIAEGDWVAARLIYTGTVRGTVPGLPARRQPTGREIRFVIHVFAQIGEDGLGVADYKEYNILGWLMQLGLIDE